MSRSSLTERVLQDVQDFTRDGQHVGQGVIQLKNDAAGVVKNVGEAVQSSYDAAKGGVMSGYKAAKDKTTEATDAIYDRIVKNPLTSVGIGVGAGLLLGIILRSLRK